MDKGSMSYDLTILVPVYNEEASLDTLLNKLSRMKLHKEAQVIVVNDGSKDKSELIIKLWMKKPQPFSVEFINHHVNKGKGAAIQSGLKKAKGFYFIIQDADLEYDPSDIPKLLKFAHDNDMPPAVYGSRFLGSIKSMPKANYLANRFYNILLFVLYGRKITDMHTCYKMVNTELFQSLNIHSLGFGYAPELVSKLMRRKVPILESPIKYTGRTVKEGKKINVRDGFECLAQLIKYRFQNEDRLFEKRDNH